MVRGARRPGRQRWLDAVRHPTQRNGIAALVLLVLPWAVALVQVLRHHHLDSGAVGIVVARHLECTIAGPDLAWWQLPLATPVFVRGATAAILELIDARPTADHT